MLLYIHTNIYIYIYIYIYIIYKYIYIHTYVYDINWDSLHAKMNSYDKAWSYKTKKHKKIKRYRKSLKVL